MLFAQVNHEKVHLPTYEIVLFRVHQHHSGVVYQLRVWAIIRIPRLVRATCAVVYGIRSPPTTR